MMTEHENVIGRIAVRQSSFRLALFLPFAVMALGIFVYSAAMGFVFFTDSELYAKGSYYVPVLSETLWLYPVVPFAIALLNTCISLYIYYRHLSLLTVFLFSPYVLLLITNLTKESFIFLGITVFFASDVYLRSRKVRILSKLASTLLFLPRPIYLVQIIPVKYAVVMGIAAVMAFWMHGGELASLFSHLSITERFAGREHIEHTGRDFFAYLCVSEKANVLSTSFIICVGRTMLFVPDHPDLLSINFFPYFLFQVGFIMLVIKLLAAQRMNALKHAAMLISLYVAIFAISPTFGAFIRYFYPVLWVAVAYMLTGDEIRRRADRGVHLFPVAYR